MSDKDNKYGSAALGAGYSIARRSRKRRMYPKGLVDPENPKYVSEDKIDTYKPPAKQAKIADPSGYTESRKPVAPEMRNASNQDESDKSLQERMPNRRSKVLKRSNILFDGKAERLDPYEETRDRNKSKRK